MKRTITFVLAITCLTMTFSIGSVMADISLLFSVDDGVSFDDTFEVTTGDSLSVDVYLTDDDGFNILANEGLLGFGVQATLLPGSQGNLESATINSEFDQQFPNFTATEFDWTAFVLSNPVPTESNVLLGELLFNATEAGTASIGFEDLLPGTGTQFVNTLSGDGTELDQLIFGDGGQDTIPLSFNVTDAVPEPQSAVILSGLFLLCLRRRSRTHIRCQS